MKSKKQKLIYGFLITLFVIQLGTITYFFLENNTLQNSLLETNFIMNTNFNSINSNINSITLELSNLGSSVESLDSSLSETQETLSETQSNLESQISSLKAKTSSDFSGIIENAVGAVVSIQTNAAQGSGFIITNDGYVVTNAHVLEDAKYATAITADSKEYPMSLVGYSSTLDLALLKINVENSEYLEFADSDNVNVGEKVIAIGNPYGLSFSVTEGIVSAIERTISGYGGKYIQTDAAINAGNSGGPLINTDGEVIGVNNLKIEGDNVGFSLESNYVSEEVNVIAEEKLGYNII